MPKRGPCSGRLVLTNPGGDITFATATDSRTAQEELHRAIWRVLPGWQLKGGTNHHQSQGPGTRSL